VTWPKTLFPNPPSFEGFDGGAGTRYQARREIRSLAEAMRRANLALRIGFVGAHVAVAPDASLAASEAIEFVAREEFDDTIREIEEGRPLSAVHGISRREVRA